MISFLKLYRGKYRRLTFHIKDPVTDLPIDITGFSFAFTVKRRTEDTDVQAVLQKTTSDGISILDAVNGYGEIRIMPADTSGQPNINLQVVEWDFQITRGGNPEILSRGDGSLAMPITRAS